MLLTYLNKHGGKETILEILDRFSIDLLSKIDRKEVTETFLQFIFQHARNIKATPILADIVEWSFKKGYDDYIISFFTGELIKLVKKDTFRSVLTELVNETIRSYESNQLRKVINHLTDINAERVSSELQNGLLSFLQEFKEPNHTYRKSMKNFLHSSVERLRTDDIWIFHVEKSKIKLIEWAQNHIHIVSELAEGYMQVAATDFETNHRTSEYLRPYLSNLIQYAESRPEMLTEIDRGIKNIVFEWVDQNHNSIGQIIKESLNTYSDEKLIGFIKERAGNDLQCIRLSGWLVGGIVGILLHLITYCLG